VGHLNALDIEARHLWKPMHLQPVHRSRRSLITGASERLFRSAVALPSGSGLSDDDVDRVIDGVLESLRAVVAPLPSHA
jgi:dTDP-4-amino-4,6-dideoxygalactose transaminase